MRRNVLAIAGLDPSGGAGLAADIKTFEAINMQGFCVATAITYQNEQKFHGLKWIELEHIEKQLSTILDFYPISGVKIGIVQDLKTLITLLLQIRRRHPDIPIVWDPIQAASAGYLFHSKLPSVELRQVLQNVDVVTPNAKEYEWIKKTGLPLSDCQYAACFVTGVKTEDEKVSDHLISNEGNWTFSHNPLEGFKKHGSGCVLSSALTAYLAKGMPVHKACRRSKEFTRAYLTSSKSLLGSFRFKTEGV